MAKGYQLGAEALRQIRKLIREDRLEAERRTRATVQRGAPDQAIYIGRTGAGGISALSGTTPGSGTVTLYRITSTGVLQAVADQYGNTVTVTAYNLATAAVAATTWVQLKQESVSGRLLVDFEDCG